VLYAPTPTTDVYVFRSDPNVLLKVFCFALSPLRTGIAECGCGIEAILKFLI
jgi:hypothetical protein